MSINMQGLTYAMYRKEQNFRSGADDLKLSGFCLLYMYLYEEEVIDINYCLTAATTKIGG